MADQSEYRDIPLYDEPGQLQPHSDSMSRGSIGIRITERTDTTHTTIRDTLTRNFSIMTGRHHNRHSIVQALHGYILETARGRRADGHGRITRIDLSNITRSTQGVLVRDIENHPRGRWEGWTVIDTTAEAFGISLGLTNPEDVFWSTQEPRPESTMESTHGVESLYDMWFRYGRLDSTERPHRTPPSEIASDYLLPLLINGDGRSQEPMPTALVFSTFALEGRMEENHVDWMTERLSEVWDFLNDNWGVTEIQFAWGPDFFLDSTHVITTAMANVAHRLSGFSQQNYRTMTYGITSPSEDF